MADSDKQARRRRVHTAIDTAVGDSPPMRVCAAAVELLAVAGVGISLMRRGVHQSTLCATDGANHPEDLQATFGEGPCVDAHNTGRPVLVGDLAADRAWPAFAPAALAAGIAAAFSFPLQAGAARIGTLDVYRAERGDLDADELADALVLADVTLHLLLDLQARAPADELHRLLADGPASSGWQVHQAAGMVATQLAVDIDEAMVRLRAHAFTSGRPLGEVAAEVVVRRLRLEDWS